MQLCALNETGILTFVDNALRHQNYHCMECGGIVRVRGGFHRRDHFYHLGQDLPCRQSAKSIEHIQVQCYLQKNLVGEVLLEKRFESISRIADVVWEDEKIIFEVQCSPILAAEVAARQRDYASCGYQVVWILHTQTFSQRRLTAAEHFLQHHPHYFTAMNAVGEGLIFDQYSFIQKGRRTKTVGPYTPSLTVCRYKKGIAVPSYLKKRVAKWGCYFEGDLVDLAFRGCLPFEKEEVMPKDNLYQKIFRILLEAACR